MSFPSGNIQLKSYHGKYLTAETKPFGALKAAADKASGWERWTVEPQSGGKVALRSAHNKLLGVEGDKMDKIVAGGDTAGNTTTLTVHHEFGDIWTFRTYAGTYLGADKKGKVFVKNSEPTDDEKWHVERYSG
eukprot:TRINITY_DN7640_c0_g1_i1.p1 TRINITY_DN7640_c0_g1~~TRINITY_DN7640_c0_g1_i1.p1  ORF type:complete len:133 (-),score=30.23 TRINITY_DN7640_c0_g1_i1:58-456(-)